MHVHYCTVNCCVQANRVTNQHLCSEAYTVHMINNNEVESCVCIPLAPESVWSDSLSHYSTLSRSSMSPETSSLSLPPMQIFICSFMNEGVDEEVTSKRESSENMHISMITKRSSTYLLCLFLLSSGPIADSCVCLLDVQQRFVTVYPVRVTGCTHRLTGLPIHGTGGLIWGQTKLLNRLANTLDKEHHLVCQM